MASTLNFACGMNKFSAAKVGKFIFGQFFREIEVDHENRMFLFIINEYIIEGDEKKFFADQFDKPYRGYFKDYWGDVPGFQLKVIEVREKQLDEKE